MPIWTTITVGALVTEGAIHSQISPPPRLQSALERRTAMTIVYIVIGVIVLGAFLYWGFKSEREEAHHLDSLHITPQADKKE
jgi:hypothetical protein